MRLTRRLTRLKLVTSFESEAWGVGLREAAGWQSFGLLGGLVLYLPLCRTRPFDGAASGGGANRR